MMVLRQIFIVVARHAPWTGSQRMLTKDGQNNTWPSPIKGTSSTRAILKHPGIIMMRGLKAINHVLNSKDDSLRILGRHTLIKIVEIMDFNPIATQSPIISIDLCSETEATPTRRTGILSVIMMNKTHIPMKVLQRAIITRNLKRGATLDLVPLTLIESSIDPSLQNVGDANHP